MTLSDASMKYITLLKLKTGHPKFLQQFLEIQTVFKFLRPKFTQLKIRYCFQKVGTILNQSYNISLTCIFILLLSSNRRNNFVAH